MTESVHLVSVANKVLIAGHHVATDATELANVNIYRPSYQRDFTACGYC